MNVETQLAGLHVYDDQWIDGKWNELVVSRHGKELDDAFADELAQTLAHFIRTITPIVDDLENEDNEEDP